MRLKIRLQIIHLMFSERVLRRGGSKAKHGKSVLIEPEVKENIGEEWKAT